MTTLSQPDLARAAKLWLPFVGFLAHALAVIILTMKSASSAHLLLYGLLFAAAMIYSSRKRHWSREPWVAAIIYPACTIGVLIISTGLS